ncbi:hypothetical protein L9F63_022681 [Diploptera punctata]|uniref:aralkylamine N-acetyltransferase n=1 Tax=Diploptera punctata TaxID=6984 RepID=A0AAD7ZMW2_DIPPU|nr:hypothetical protein L9F63_022681 [Diploptera punctata]
MLAEGLSLMAISKNDQNILGICLNKCKIKNKTPEYRDDKIGRFLNEVESGVNIWELGKTDRAFSINILAVSESSRGTGVGKALMEHSREKARSAGYSLLYVLCTSYYSDRIARNMGMQCVYTLPYSEYKDEQGNPVFVPPAPHTQATVLIEKL